MCRPRHVLLFEHRSRGREALQHYLCLILYGSGSFCRIDALFQSCAWVLPSPRRHARRSPLAHRACSALLPYSDPLLDAQAEVQRATSRGHPPGNYQALVPPLGAAPQIMLPAAGDGGGRHRVAREVGEGGRCCIRCPRSRRCWRGRRGGKPAAVGGGSSSTRWWTSRRRRRSTKR